MNKRYCLELYVPGSDTDVWMSYESDQPFLAISAGDLLSPFCGFPEQKFPEKKDVARVLSVEHIVWQEDGAIRHKLMVFSELVEPSRELRLGSRGLSQH